MYHIWNHAKKFGSLTAKCSLLVISYSYEYLCKFTQSHFDFYFFDQKFVFNILKICNGNVTKLLLSFYFCMSVLTLYTISIWRTGISLDLVFGHCVFDIRNNVIYVTPPCYIPYKVPFS